MVVDLGSVLEGDEERWDIDHSVVDGDVSVSDSASRVVDGVGELGLEHKGLESSLKELIDVEGKDIIQTILSISVEESELEHSVQQGLSFESSLWIIFFKGQEFSSSLSNSGDSQLNSPNFTFVLESILTTNFDFVLDSFLFERSLWGFGSFGT